MPESTLTLPESAVSVAALVAEAYAAHEAHARQRFARDAARTLRAMRPAVHDEATRAAAAAFDAAARVVLMLAGLDAGQGRTAPDALAEVGRD
ncbi:hypothetical protein OIE13_22650 [Streptosporangium sp. NBC_01810]|uniref:hypothetical protein n=1 Tax=Streptosporangium sp. NBC_01810 TaxID=2975951 RepID=UPI002DDC7946|nr:hypothetical protein [Streptosporangium sp. NBC_01810]WSA23745.1 hypothetical protein OIE13_22650 [Streptosporangium sp. NBC_01810]